MTASPLPSFISDLSALTEGQLSWVEDVITSLKQPIDSFRWPSSDIVSDQFLYEFGEGLKLHHHFSSGPLTKSNFEHMLERVSRRCGRTTQLARRGNPGHDITIDGTRYSLKTQTDSQIKEGVLYISKYMELGKGRWEDEADLAGLRDQFLRHLENYDRILSLRAFHPGRVQGPPRWRYELVEIPKALLQQAAHGRIEMRFISRQNPKPGYCTVTDQLGNDVFQLYFDAGTERKLQIKKLKKSFCVVHAGWSFPTSI